MGFCVFWGFELLRMGNVGVNEEVKIGIKFCGAAGTTTGSQHLLEVNGQKILLDCGLYQGRSKEQYEVNCCFPHFDPEEIDCVVLSHAHIDHSGNLPNLCEKGFKGSIYSTFATRDLCQIMLADSARIQEHDARWLSRKRKKQGLPPVEPLYTERAAERCLRQFVNVGYRRQIPIGNGVFLTFLDAGHILGSAQVQLDIEDLETKERKRLLFSGDVGRPTNDLLRAPDVAEDVDFLLMESTYGGREHGAAENSVESLAEVLERSLERGGKILIPAFAVERTQQLLVVLNEIFRTGRLPEVPVYVDSPLAVSATEIFRLHPECFNEGVYETLFENGDPFGFEHLTLIRSVKASKELTGNHQQAIVIASSGMCEAGRIKHHLRHGIEDSKTTVLFVGYCAQHTLGWKIREGFDQVNIFGYPQQVRAQVESIESFSGHADHSELLDYFRAMSGSKAKVWLVHGEKDRSEALRDALREEHAGAVEVAELGATVEFGEE